ncbi:MAG: flippase-like domain-containing protein [Deltaproteobacteria bacterium]|nr:flippase-like domain-containing protein [Deltaproteobacteria bacterium]
MGKKFLSISQDVPPNISRRILSYFGMAALFFALSFATIYILRHSFSGAQVRIPSNFLSLHVIGSLTVLLLLYFLADGLRLYCIIRAIGSRIGFIYIIKLVFINIFVSNVTPFATGGGLVQIYFMKQRGMPIGEATAATSIRTIIAGLIIFTLTPIIIWFEPNLFRIFFQKNIFYIVTIFSCLYLAGFWIIIFRIKTIKRFIYLALYALNVFKLLPRPRFRSLFLRFCYELDLFSAGFKKYFRSGSIWAILSIASTALFLLLLFSFSVLLVRFLGYEVPMLTILSFEVVVTFFMYFTPTPGAAGVAEGGYGLLFAQLVQEKDILLLTLSWRFLTIYVGLTIGIFIIYGEIFNHRRAARKLDLKRGLA